MEAFGIRKEGLVTPAVTTQTVVTKQRIHLFVDKTSLQWIAREEDGSYWVLTSRENPWEHRQAVRSIDQLQLEPVPGHYKHMLGIPG